MKHVCVVFALAWLAGCETKPTCSEFIGRWDSAEETIVVSEAGDGCRVVSTMKDGMGFEIEVKLIPESKATLVTVADQAKGLSMSADGKLTSHLRNKERVFSRG